MPRHASILGLESFQLPAQTPEFNLSSRSHPCLDADPAHRLLRGTVMAVRN
jgi:hypothetical protein